MNGFKVSYDGSMRYKVKPNKYDTAMISDRIPHCVKTVNTDQIQSFVGLVSKKGMPFCPATFTNGVRKKDNFDQLQLLTLDFDNDNDDKQISFQDIKDRAGKLHLPILFAYDTHSSSVHHDKFRVVFLNDVSIPNKKIAEIAINALQTIFPEADSSCKDVSRMFYGGKGLLYFDDSIPQVNLESVIRNMSICLKEKYGDTHYKRKIAEFAKENGVALNKNKMLDVFISEKLTEKAGANQNGKISPNPIILSKSLGENLPTINYIIRLNDDCTNRYSVEKRPNRIHAPYRSSFIDDISKSCKLFKEFETGSRRLSHDERFGIATNLIQIELGAKRFKDILSEDNFYDDSVVQHWSSHLGYFKQNEYKPASCSVFCPYHKECKHGRNILSTVKPKYHKMERLSNCEERLFPIEEAEKDVRHKIEAAVCANDTKWHIIKAQTAIGKTEIYLRLMKESDKRFLIAVPTNILKDDVCQRACNMNIDVMTTPSLDEIKDEMPDEIWEHIQHLYRTGESKKVYPYINKVLKEQDIACLKRHLKKVDKVKTFGGHVITTHRRFMNMTEEILKGFDVIMIDEDIIFKSIIPNQCEIPISDLKKLARDVADIKLAKKIKDVLKSAKTESLFIAPAIEWSGEKDSDSVSTHEVDTLSFCMSKHFCCRKASEEKNLTEDTVVFLKPVKFKNIKHIMVSATADETICKYVFGESNITFYNCKKAGYKGVIHQYYDKSMSRACIDQDTDIFRKIKEHTGIKNIITFKKYNIGDLYFGNTEGCNHLAGQDINVIGTPYQAEFLYKLFPYTIGLDFDKDTQLKPNLTATHNGYRFRFTTYEDEVLRAVHFYMIESELEQAVGRARLLRYDCMVNLFSNFPLSQSDMKEREYEKCSAADEVRTHHP